MQLFIQHFSNILVIVVLFVFNQKLTVRQQLERKQFIWEVWQTVMGSGEDGAGQGSQLRVAVKSAATVGAWRLIPQRNSGKWCRTRASEISFEGQGSWVPQDEAVPSGFNSEHFQPEQPSKTLEKAPQERKEDTCR